MRMAILWRAALAVPLLAQLLSAQAPQAADSQPDVLLPDAAQAKQIAGILEAGFGEGDKAARDAEARLEALRRDPHHDPRGDYAFGLVMLHHFKPREAREAFQAAVDSSRVAYLPAWMAHVRIRLLRRDHEAGFEHLTKLASLLADPATPWSDPNAPADGAFWLGRVVGACQLAAIKVNKGPDPAALDESFRRLFDADLRDAYRRGRESIDKEHDELSDELDRAALVVERMQNDREKRRRVEIDRQRRKIRDEAKTVEMTREEWKAWLDEELERIDKELTSLEKEYDTLADADAQVQQAMAQLRSQLNAARFAERAAGARSQRDTTVRLSLQIEQRLTQFQVQRLKLIQEAQGINQQARELVSQREKATDRYQTATGQLAKEATQTQKWKKAFEKATKQNKATSGRATRSARTRKRRLTQIATYLDFDVQEARQGLLDELGQSTQ